MIILKLRSGVKDFFSKVKSCKLFDWNKWWCDCTPAVSILMDWEYAARYQRSHSTASIVITSQSKHLNANGRCQTVHFYFYFTLLFSLVTRQIYRVQQNKNGIPNEENYISYQINYISYQIPECCKMETKKNEMCHFLPEQFSFLT